MDEGRRPQCSADPCGKSITHPMPEYFVKFLQGYSTEGREDQCRYRPETKWTPTRTGECPPHFGGTNMKVNS